MRRCTQDSRAPTWRRAAARTAYRALTLVRRLYPENWFAPLGMAVLYAATERPDEARPLLDEAFRLGGDVARSTAAGYPALAPLLVSATAPVPP